MRLFSLLLAAACIGQCYAAGLTAKTSQLEALDILWGEQVAVTKTMTRPVPRFSLPGMEEHKAAMQSKVADRAARAMATTTYSTSGWLSYTLYEKSDQSCKNGLVTTGVAANECVTESNYAVSPCCTARRCALGFLCCTRVLGCWLSSLSNSPSNISPLHSTSSASLRTPARACTLNTTQTRRARSCSQRGRTR
jgi:hypothetical protein